MPIAGLWEPVRRRQGASLLQPTGKPSRRSTARSLATTAFNAVLIVECATRFPPPSSPKAQGAPPSSEGSWWTRIVTDRRGERQSRGRGGPSRSRQPGPSPFAYSINRILADRGEPVGPGRRWPTRFPRENVGHGAGKKRGDPDRSEAAPLVQSQAGRLRNPRPNKPRPISQRWCPRSSAVVRPHTTDCGCAALCTKILCDPSWHRTAAISPRASTCAFRPGCTPPCGMLRGVPACVRPSSAGER